MFKETCNCDRCVHARHSACSNWLHANGLHMMQSKNPKERKGRACPYCQTVIADRELIAGHYGVKWGHPECVQSAYIHRRLLSSTLNADRRPDYLQSKLKVEKVDIKTSPLLPPGAVYSVGKPEYIGHFPQRQEYDVLKGQVAAQISERDMREWMNEQLDSFAVPANLLFGVDPAKGPDKTVMTQLNRNGDQFAFVPDETGRELPEELVKSVCDNMTAMLNKGCAGPAEHINVEIKLDDERTIRYPQDVCPHFSPRLVSNVSLPDYLRPHHRRSKSEAEERGVEAHCERLMAEQERLERSMYLARTRELPCCPEHGPATFECLPSRARYLKVLWLVCRKEPQRLKEDFRKLLNKENK